MLSCICICPRANAADASPRAQLPSTISAMIADLKASKPDYKKFIKSYCNPEDVKELVETKMLDETAAGFGDKTAGTLLKVLQYVKDKKPADTSDKTVNYDIKALADKDGLPEDVITFLKIDGLWYLKN